MQNCKPDPREGKTLYGFIVVLLVVLGLDQVSKLLVESKMLLGQSLPVVDKLVCLTYVHNQGGAFGLFAGRGTLFLTSAVAVILISLYYVARHRPGPRLEIPLAFVAGGAAGNLVDRVVRGGVVDFIDVGFWPVFNLADCAIVLGAIWLFWVITRGGDGEWVHPWR